jgi:asparagine synthase (glutamine-hydrolysing)
MAPAYRDVLARGSALPSAIKPSFLDLVTYLPDDILTKVDRASMAVSLEVRSPLLDHRVVEFALGLPMAFKRKGTTLKWLLRQVLYKRVPAALVDRPKMGFGVPLNDWFAGPLRDRMDHYCASGEVGNLGLDPAPVAALWREWKNGRYARPDVLWQFFVLMSWSRQFLRANVAA